MTVYLGGVQRTMLQIRSIQKIIDERVALAIEALDVAPGKIVAIIGPMSGGPSLLMRVLCGEVPLSGGTIRLGDRSLLDDPAARGRIGVLFADDLLYKRQTVQENLDLIAQMRGRTPAQVTATLDLLGLRDQARTRVAKLAPTQQRRVALARAVLAQQGLLMLERPIARVDLATQALMVQAIQGVARDGAAVLVIDDDLTWVNRFCHEIFEMADGRIVSHLTPAALAAPTPEPLAAPESGEAPPLPAETGRFVPFKVPARCDDRIVLFDPNEILYATSRDSRTFLRTATEEVPTNLTLQELEARLVGWGFFKAHRAYLVNLQHIRSVFQYTRNSYILQLDDAPGTQIPLSKQSEKALQELLGY